MSKRNFTLSDCTPSDRPSDSNSNITRQLLHDQLMALSFPDFARLMCRLLSKLGYEDVRLMGITSGTGRNSYGGFDLQATAYSGLSQLLLLAQIKQYRHPIPRSFVDELRGAMARLGAQQGLLITTSSFSGTAQCAADARNTLPVTLIGGDKLVDLMIEHDITIAKPSSTAGKGKISRSTPEQSELQVETNPSPQAEVQISFTVGIPNTSTHQEFRRDSR